MARTNRLLTLRLLALLFLLLMLAGCASYLGRQAFEEAERYEAEGDYAMAVGKYYQAAELAPDNRLYKLKLLSTRTRAAGDHVQKARDLARRGEIDAAIEHYRRARGFDPSVEVAAKEEKTLLDRRQAEVHAEEAAGFYDSRQLSLARKAISQALQLNPNNARALALQDLLDKGRATLTMDGFELDLSSSEPITLRFKDANIKEVFGILSKLTGINFIFDADIREQGVSVLLEKANLAEALELLLQMNGLGKKVLNSKTIIIYPQTKEKEKQYEDQIIQTFYLSHIDAKKAVNLLRTMLQLRKIYVHEERNALVIRDTPQVIRLAEQVLDAADRENSEVLFSLELIAVQNTDELQLGPTLSNRSISIGFGGDAFETIETPTTGTTPVTLTGTLAAATLKPGGSTKNLITDFSNLTDYYTLPTATFDLAKTLTDTEVLASPRIRVRNKEKAKVHIGTREPVITVTTTGDTSTDNIQYVDVGVKVDVEPNIQLDNTVETKLTLEVSQVIDRFQTDNGSVALTISTTNAQSTLTLKDGVQTIIGGLFEKQSSSSVSTIPLLGDLPLVGKLFSGLNDRDTKREILLSITPYIVKQVEVPALDVATIWSGGEDNLKDGPNFGAFAKPVQSEVQSTRPSPAPALIKPEPQVMPAESGLPSGEPASPAALPVQEPSAVPEVVPDLRWRPRSLDVPLLNEPELVPGEGEIPEPPLPPEAVVVPEQTEVPAVAAESLPVEDPIDPAVLATPQTLELPGKGPARLAIAGPTAVSVGDDISLAVEISNAERLYSAPLFVAYDPQLLELTVINEGSLLKKDGQSTVFSSSPNRTTGQIIVGYKQGAGGTGASGSGLLFTLGFRAKAAGTAEVELNRINFRDPDGTRLAVEPAAATVEIR